MNSYRPSGGFAPYGLLSDDSYNEEDPRFALSYGGGGATGLLGASGQQGSSDRAAL